MAIMLTNPNSAGPFAGFQQKDVRCKVFDVPFGSFTTGGTDTLLGAIPSDSSITSIKVYVKTALTGNSVSSPTVKFGSASGGTQFSGTNTATTVTNVLGAITSVVADGTGFYALWNPPYTTGDIQIWLHGACSTGSPTAGEYYVQVDYVT